MIYLVLPVGSYHGWGVCGKYLTREFSLLTDTKLITYGFNEAEIADPLDYHFLKDKYVGQEMAEMFKNGALPLNQPTLQGTVGPLLPWEITSKSAFKAGYTFFENNILTPDYMENGKKYFDVIVTGSKWCEEVLRQYGLENVETVIQGIDPQIFNPYDNDKKYFKDKFVIFSGGKFELRKGQDLVIRAFKALQDKYSDVLLITSWFNKWPVSFNTMAGSPLIKCNASQQDYKSRINQVFIDNGVDLNKVINLLPCPNTSMARIYKNTDIGLFPNRCEGGTNLVLMEYMACGKPVIASYNTGHKDILTPENSIMLQNMHETKIRTANSIMAVWDTPDLDEMIANLEWAYNNRDKLSSVGQQAGSDLAGMTWKESAEGFYNILKQAV